MTVAQHLRAELARRGLDWIVPDWPAPANVGALVTTRSGEDAEAGSELLRVVTGVQPFWLRQVHGASVAVGGIDPSGTPADAARAYQDELQSHYGAERLDPARPLFDIVLLGMGPDGHTASLIPGEPVLDEKARWVAEVTHGRPEPRITLTYPALDSSRSTAFVAAGGDKHAMMQRVVAGERELPAARIRPVGELIWFIDEAAHGGR